ncbi:MAG: Branched-chain amino acid transport ATP-binding protein LivG [Anaerolineae bacterium]|nr:MAG: Branched-chain amino acid transport ATP-binding protein LivG [Anaerolineae bacterium]
MGNIITLDHVCMYFGGVKAVDDLSLQVHQGEIIGIIGPNGAGKTTVFNLLSGVYIPTSGDIFFKDKRINKYPPHVITSSGIARTFQNIRLFGQLSALDNVLVAFYSRIKYGLIDTLLNSHKKINEERKVRTEALRLLELMGLKEKAEVAASNLAYGEQRRLEIARALACRPEVLLLDEPAAGMNPLEIDELNQTIVQLRDQFGLTILLVEHQMRLVMGICERVLVMNFGKKLALGSPAEIRNNPEVLEAYLGKAHQV